MTFPQRRLLGWSVLVLVAALGGAWLARLDFRRKISTDVLDLIPPAERAPELALVRALASEAEARTMLIALTAAPGGGSVPFAREAFLDELRHAPEFAQVVALDDPAWRDGIGRQLHEQRMTLLFPAWLAAHKNSSADALAAAAARELKDFLAKPEAVAFQDLVPGDPLLLLPRALADMKGGVGLAPTNETTGLIWAQLAVSPLREEGQKPVFAAIERAAKLARERCPGLVVSYTGVNRFAAASRARIEREVSWLNALSLAAVFAVAWIFIRGVHRALHLVPVVLFSVLGAWVVTTLAFERVHIVVFVLGALLSGVAIDYGFYLYMQPPAAPEEEYPAKVRRLMKPLLASCFTTVTGFALLLFSELPMIRQLGVFVGAGLLAALGGAIAYFATVRHPFLEARTFRGGQALAAGTRANLRRVLLICWLAALPGLARVTWRDDIRELEVPARDIQADDARLRAAFGQRADRVVFLTHGATPTEARAALSRFQAWLGPRGTATNLAPLVPTPEEWTRARAFLREQPQFPEKLRAALNAEGFDAASFAPFFSSYNASAATAPDLDAALVALQRSLVGPPSLLLHVGEKQSWFVTIATEVRGDAPPPETQTVAASQLQSLNRLFANYRASALRLSAIGLAIVGLGVFLTYGLRDGVRIFAIPCGACLGIFGLFGWLGQPLNLFHLLGAFLGVCLTHNYSIFSATSAYRREPPPVSVRLSALTAAASFGVLGLSGIPVVHALGAMVATMVLLALLVIELEHLSPLARRA